MTAIRTPLSGNHSTSPSAGATPQTETLVSRVSSFAAHLLSTSVATLSSISSSISQTVHASSHSVTSAISHYLGNRQLADLVDNGNFTYPMQDNANWMTVPEQLENLLISAINQSDSHVVEVLCYWAGGLIEPELRQRCVSQASRLNCVESLQQLLNQGGEFTQEQLIAGCNAALEANSLRALSFLLTRGQALSAPQFLTIVYSTIDKLMSPVVPLQQSFVTVTSAGNHEVNLKALLVARPLSNEQLIAVARYIIDKNNVRALNVLLAHYATSLDAYTVQLCDQNKASAMFLNAARQNCTLALDFLPKLATNLDFGFVFVEAASCGAIDSLRWLWNQHALLSNEQIYTVLARAAEQGDLGVLKFMLEEAKCSMPTLAGDEEDALYFVDVVVWAINGNHNDAVVYLMGRINLDDLSVDQKSSLLRLAAQKANANITGFLENMFQEQSATAASGTMTTLPAAGTANTTPLGEPLGTNWYMH